MKTTAEHNKALRQARKAQGLQEVRVWTRPEHRPAIIAMAKKLTTGNQADKGEGK